MNTILTDKELEHMRDSFLLKDASEETIERAAERVHVREYPRGSLVYDEEDYERELGLILTGRLEVTKNGSYVMNSLTPGNFFGAAALFGENEEYVTRLAACEETRIAFFTQELLMELMREDFRIAENYMAFLTGRIRFLNGKIGELVQNGSAGSLRHWLSQNIHREGGRCWTQIPSFTKLASMLHMSRSSLYRALDLLEGEGLIEKNGKRIYIPNPETLEIEED